MLDIGEYRERRADAGYFDPRSASLHAVLPLCDAGGGDEHALPEHALHEGRRVLVRSLVSARAVQPVSGDDRPSAASPRPVLSPGGALPAGFRVDSLRQLTDLAPPKHPPLAGNGGERKRRERGPSGQRSFEPALSAPSDGLSSEGPRSGVDKINREQTKGKDERR